MWDIAKIRKLSTGKTLLYVPLDHDNREMKLYNKGVRQLLFFKDENNKLKMSLLELIADSNYLRKNNYLIDINNYTGMANAYNLETGQRGGYYFINGKIKGWTIAEKNYNIGQKNSCDEVGRSETFRFANGVWGFFIFYSCPSGAGGTSIGGFYYRPAVEYNETGRDYFLEDNYQWYGEV